MDSAPRSPTSPTSLFSRFRVNDGLPHIFALVIGIDSYSRPDYPNLTCAVSDANKFEGLLIDKLNVPQNQIISLRDEQGTRAAIIHAFERLRIDPRIAKDEAAIIIYFAGHGASVDKPQEWDDWVTADERIEQMCPSDIGVEVDGKEVVGIPDRTISVLLNHLSELKGDNITLILDCCSSGGLNRSVTADKMVQGVPRQIFNPPPIPRDCDNKLLGRERRDAGVAKGFSGKYHASHVLLAACGRKESAYESKSGGFFTSALVKSLTRFNVDNLTYTSLMHGLNMPRWQTPHCEGQHVNRRLFNKRASGAHGSFILTHLDKATEKYLLHAGAAQGITLGSTFGVHLLNLISDSRHSNASLGVLVVTEVNTFTSVLALPLEGPVFAIPPGFYSKMIQRGADGITIYSKDQPWLEAIFPPDICIRLGTKTTDDPLKALLWLVRDERGQVHFERNDPMITPFIGARFLRVVDQDNVDLIRQVVRGYIHFSHHLTRTGDDFKNVLMELRTLNVEYSEDFDTILTPVGDDLIENEPATVIVDENARLGMTISNQTDLPLYPYVFYFDPSDLVIIDWYKPPFGAGAGNLNAAIDPPLPPKSTLAIGYGDGGESPWQFLLRDEEDKDVGFFKLFLTTSPVDFSSVAQESPFDENTSRAGKPSGPKLPDAERWGSKLSTIIQLRCAFTNAD